MENLEGIQALLAVINLPEACIQKNQKATDLKNSQSNTNQTIPIANTDVCPICKGNGFVCEIHEGVERWGNCQCVIAEIEKKRLKSAEIGAEFRNLGIKDFDVNIYQKPESVNRAKLIKKAIARYVEQFDTFREIGKGFYFYSHAAGSGKTRMALSLGNALHMVYKVSVRFTTSIDLLNKIKATFDTSNKRDIDCEEHSQEQFIKAFRDIDVLILDDVGTENQTGWVNEVFYSILNYRMDNKKITIFTSNFEAEKLRLEYKTIERIIKMALLLEFPDESVRLNLAKKDNEEMLKILLE